MKKFVAILMVAVAPMVFAGCGGDDSNDEVRQGQDTPTTEEVSQGQDTTVQTMNRREACENFRGQMCVAFERCNLYTEYGWTSDADCEAFFNQDVSNCGGCDKTRPDPLTVAQHDLLRDCLSSMPTEQCSNVKDLKFVGCDPYLESVGAATCE